MKTISNENVGYLVLGYLAGGATLWVLIQLGFLLIGQ